MQDTKQSEYDMSFSTLGRINYQLWHANESRRENDYDGWWKSLENIHMEILTFLKTDEKTELTKQYDDCQKTYEDWATYNANYSHQPTHKRGPYNPPRVHKDWIKYESRLRELMDKYGLLMKKAEDSWGATVWLRYRAVTVFIGWMASLNENWT